MEEILGVLGIAKSTYYRRKRQATSKAAQQPRVPHTQRRYPNRLPEDVYAEIVHLLQQGKTAGRSVYQTYYHHLDTHWRYLASLSSFYRIAKQQHVLQKSTTRRMRRRAHRQQRPQLSATRPDEIYCWDVTYMPGLTINTSFALYTVIDLYSRKIVGFTVQQREQASLAAEMFEQILAATTRKVQIIHADNGAMMTSKTLQALYAKHDITTSYSRPYVSNDNPHIESWFKTLKYHTTWPKTFASIEQAYAYAHAFITFYNTEHYHEALGGYTPDHVYNNTWTHIAEQRQRKMLNAYHHNPHRGHGKPPTVTPPPAKTTINLENDGTRVNYPRAIEQLIYPK